MKLCHVKFSQQTVRQEQLKQCNRGYILLTHEVEGCCIQG